MRARTLISVAVAVALWAVALGAGPAGAQEDDHDDDGVATTVAPPAPAGEVGIGDGLSFSGAIVFDPSGGRARELDAYQAAVFVQSWLPTSIFGGDDIERDPPAGTPTHRVDITGTWGGGGSGTMTAYYATADSTVFVAFPQDQPVRPDATGEAPPPADWFVVPERVTDAFNGEAELQDTEGTRQATSTTTSDAEAERRGAADDGDEDDGVPVWVWAAGVAAVAAIAVLALRSRRR